MSEYTQQGRPLSIETSLGDDVLLLVSFSGSEQMSGMFNFTVELSSTNDSIDPSKIVGTNVTLNLRLLDDTQRPFNGYVSRFTYLGHDERLSHYRAEIVPWLWFLTRTTDCRIFQSKTAQQIVTQIFNDLGFSDFDDSGISGPHQTLDYCVQYRETDFNFISRLLEHEGIYYFFRHEAGKHTLVMSDQKTGYVDCPEKSPMFTEEQGSTLITSWEHGYDYRSGKCTHTDYNFETPSAKLLTTENTVLPLQKATKYDLYDYPGLYQKKGDGQDLVKWRMEEDEAAYDKVNGTSLCRTFLPGGKFSIAAHPSAAEEGKSYVLLSVQHFATMAGGYSTGGSGGTIDYHNNFTCIPASVIFRPPRVTPKPAVKGVQTAVVVGPAGEEIYTDKYGRVKVQFFWDREGKLNESSSFWIRASHPWAGSNWGAIFLPRIGQEVIIDFLEGDPDRPIITGRVYNASNMPPYELPANATQSGIKTRSSKGGGGANFNEIRFEDKKGAEELFIQAEKNMNTVVENDQTLHVGHDRTNTIGHDETITVGNNRTETIKNNETVTVVNDRVETVNGNETLTVVKNRTRAVNANESVTVALMRTHTVGINEAITVGAAQEVTIGAAQTVTVGAAQTITVGAIQATTVGAAQMNTVGSSQTNTIGSKQTNTIGSDQTSTIGGKQSDTIASDRATSVGGDDSLSVGKKLVISAADEITITVGDACITMKKDGTITINGKDISLAGSGKIDAVADGNMVLKGAKVGIN